MLQYSVDSNAEEDAKDLCTNFIAFILRTDEDSGNGSAYIQKCFASMQQIKDWLQNLADKINSASVLGHAHSPEFQETIEYQRISLVRQHESLGIITQYLVKSKHSVVSDFEHLLNVLKRFDKYDNLLGMYQYQSRFCT